MEPYPEFYARVKYFAEEQSRLFEAADYTAKNVKLPAELKVIKQRQMAFFKKMAETVGTLETLAKKELKAEPFTEQEKAFVKKTVDIRGGGSGPPCYDGWYCDLFYTRLECAKWDPIVADVHTDPSDWSLQGGACLEGGGGRYLGMIAVDNENDPAVYAGPLYSYYEFLQPVKDWLTDQQWQEMYSVRQGAGPAVMGRGIPAAGRGARAAAREIGVFAELLLNNGDSVLPRFLGFVAEFARIPGAVTEFLRIPLRSWKY